MNRTMRNLAATSGLAVMLTGAASMAANATYLGYGNGDPGNWDMWTEQSGGPKPAAPNHPTHAKAIHHASVHHHQQKPVHQS